MRARPLLTFILLSGWLAGCHPVTNIGIKFLYRQADLPPHQIVRDLCYVPSERGQNPEHLLDLYLPTGKDFPVLIFIHGGGWDTGEKQMRVEGADVYANIGRLYASKGIGTAVINYGLQPKTNWRQQIEDVRKALDWVHSNIGTYGGRADDIFLMGHSAGAYLASFVALEESAKGKIPYLKGIISVSGAGLDLADEKTYALGEDPAYYERRFKGTDAGNDWKTKASPINQISAKAPPFLILYAGGEVKGLQRQSQIFDAALRKNGVSSKIKVVPGENHSLMVLVLSRADKAAAPEIISFIGK